MTSTHPAYLATLVPLLALAFTRPAHADASVTLEYEAPGGCPTQAEFVAAVTARGSRFDAIEATARLRSIDVSIRQGAAGFEGSLRIEATAGSSAVREVHAGGCAEVADGLAIVAAIALSGTAEAPASPASPAPRKDGVESSKPASPTPPPSPRALETKRRFTGSSFDKLDREVQVSGALRFDPLRTVALNVGVDYGLLPGLVMPRYELSTSLANFVTLPETSSGSKKAHLVGPILEVKWALYGPGTTRNKGFETKVFGIEAGVRSCSAFRYDNLALSLLGCAEFSIGALNLETHDAQGLVASKKESGFGSAGLVLAARYGLSSLFYVDLRVGGRMQLGGLSAERADGSRIFEPQLFGAFGQAGLGLQF